MNNNIRAILLTVSGSFFAVLMEALIRAAQYDSNVYTIGFLRFFFGFVIILGLLLFFISQSKKNESTITKKSILLEKKILIF